MSIRIEQIVFENYRQYGSGRIMFPSPDKNNLSVIIAKNGTGKTTLLNSITWCLYEKEQQLLDKESALSVVSIAELEKAEINSIIPVSVAVKISDDDDEVEFKRTQQFKKVLDNEGNSQGIPGATFLTVSTTKPGTKNTLVEKDYEAELKVKKYFDPAIYDFYFFDGEQLKEFFSPDRTDHIKESIYNIAQVTLLRNACKHVKTMREEKQRQMGKTNPDVKSLVKQQEDCETQLELAQKQLVLNTENKKKMQQKKAGLDKILVDYAPIKSLQEERKKLENTLLSYDAEKDALINDRADLIYRYTILIKLYASLRKTLDIIQKKEIEGDLPPAIDKNQIKMVLDHLDEPCPLCAHEIGETGRQHLESLLSKIAVSSQTSNYLKEIKGPLEICFDNVRQYPKEREQLQQKEKDLTARVNEVEERLKEINATLVNYPDVDGKINIPKIEKDRSDIVEKISAYDMGIGAAKATIKFNENELVGIKKKIDDAAKKLGVKNALKQDFMALTNIESSFEHIDEVISSNMRKEIEAITWNMFDSMIWKHNTFGRINIGSNYNVKVYNKEGAVMTGSLSATEQMALAYAFTLAIHNASGKNCPLVIDSPLGRVSDENRENMAKSLLEISKDKQIIMLFTPDEFSDSVKNIYEGNADIRVLKLSIDEKYVEGIADNG